MCGLFGPPAEDFTSLLALLQQLSQGAVKSDKFSVWIQQMCQEKAKKLLWKAIVNA